jgi:hypothetical protein
LGSRRLSNTAYELVLTATLESDPELFFSTLKAWDTTMYDSKRLTQRVETQVRLVSGGGNMQLRG